MILLSFESVFNLFVVSIVSMWYRVNNINVFE